MIAVVPVRGGELPSGAAEAAAEAGGRALLVGEQARQAALMLRTALGLSTEPATQDRNLDKPAAVVAGLLCSELGPLQPGRWAAGLAEVVGDEDVVLLPASPDGRDLAPRLAAELDRPLFAGALAVDRKRVVLVRLGGRVVEEHEPTVPFVATLLPGSRAIPAAAADFEPTEEAEIEAVPIELGDGRDATVVEVVEADPAVIDLAEAERILAGGAGLGGEEAFRLLFQLGKQLNASVGATRVVTDAGLVDHERQIGTTGVSVNPRCYLAFGVSGAAQHLGGIGDPEHIAAANLDPSCPMMATADLALVTDARQLVEALVGLLGGAHA